MIYKGVPEKLVLKKTVNPQIVYAYDIVILSSSYREMQGLLQICLLEACLKLLIATPPQ